jgi:glycosyltransferase involved in cell wall biosynthesis
LTDVTIVIPTRERPDYLRATLHSVLASAAEARIQGVETRVLVVDDASPSESTSLLARELGVDYHRITVHDGRNNPATAIATGVGLVESRYYSVFGDDDIMLPRFIGAQVTALEAGHDVCTASYIRTDADLRTVREVILPDPVLGDLLAGQITINDGAMTRTELVRGLPWDPSLGQVIFYPIWLELLFRGSRFTRLVEPLFLYRRHTRNISDRLDDHDALLRAEIRDRYMAATLARDGAIPGPTAAVQTPAKAVRTTVRRPLWRRVASRLRGRLRRGSREP